MVLVRIFKKQFAQYQIKTGQSGKWQQIIPESNITDRSRKKEQMSPISNIKIQLRQESRWVRPAQSHGGKGYELQIYISVQSRQAEEVSSKSNIMT